MVANLWPLTEAVCNIEWSLVKCNRHLFSIVTFECNQPCKLMFIWG